MKFGEPGATAGSPGAVRNMKRNLRIASRNAPAAHAEKSDFLRFLARPSTA
ncbi:MAG TPA: hypothetical protein VMB81_29430 [Candidatus Sulfotelmatobacter sp.]|nr:hypothetical protein [Candidatus Sulfotelmatobacter sp.]